MVVLYTNLKQFITICLYYIIIIVFNLRFKTVYNDSI